MPSVINDSELTTGLTKARPVVIPDRMPMTTLNLDLDGGAKTRKDVQKKQSQSPSNCLGGKEGSVHRDKYEAKALA